MNELIRLQFVKDNLFDCELRSEIIQILVSIRWVKVRMVPDASEMGFVPCHDRCMACEEHGRPVEQMLASLVCPQCASPAFKFDEDVRLFEFNLVQHVNNIGVLVKFLLINRRSPQGLARRIVVAPERLHHYRPPVRSLVLGGLGSGLLKTFACKAKEPLYLVVVTHCRVERLLGHDAEQCVGSADSLCRKNDGIMPEYSYGSAFSGQLVPYRARISATGRVEKMGNELFARFSYARLSDIPERDFSL